MLLGILVLGNVPTMVVRDDWNTIAALGSAVAAIAALIGLVLTYLSNRSTQQAKTYEAIRSQAEKSLAAAYDVLTNGGTSIPPAQNRLNWLTAARHILRYKKLKLKLRGVHQTVVDEVEEYWRHRMYLAVAPLERAFGYYSPRQNLMEPDEESELEEIDAKSALVVLMFAEWPPDLTDPLDEVTASSYAPVPRIFSLRHAAFEPQLVRLLDTEKERAGES